MVEQQQEPGRESSDGFRAKGLIVHFLVLGVLFLLYLFAERSESRLDDGVILSVFIVYALWFTYRTITPALARYLTRNALRQRNAVRFLVLWRWSWVIFGVIFAAISFSGSLATLGISAAFVAMVLGWSLQGPVIGVAAWLMVIARKPFQIGDRVIISGVTGDVEDINFTHVILQQVGGTIPGEEKSGRTVMIPNPILFQQVIVNYTRDSEFILDEVQVTVSARSDLAQAKDILLHAAREVTDDIIEATDEEPYIRLEIAEKGIVMRLRFRTRVPDRQRIASEVSDRIVRAIGDPAVRVELSNAPKESLSPPKKEDASIPAGPSGGGAPVARAGGQTWQDSRGGPQEGREEA